MKPGTSDRTFQGSLLLLVAFTTASPASVAERYFGEPVALKGQAIYFTSWKYVRQGSFAWRVQMKQAKLFGFEFVQ